MATKPKTFVNVPLSLQEGAQGNRLDQQENDSFDVEELPKGKQFGLLTPYQTTYKQKLALLFAFILYASSFALFVIILTAINTTGIFLAFILLLLFISTFILIPYSFGAFDQSEQWRNYVIIIDKNMNDTYIKNKVHLIKESTYGKCKKITVLENVTFGDIEFYEKALNSWIIKINGVVVNEYGVSNTNAALLVDKMMKYLTSDDDDDDNERHNNKVCVALGCDICSFRGCSCIILILSVLLNIFVICYPMNEMTHILCNDNIDPTDGYSISDGDSIETNNGCDMLAWGLLFGLKFIYGLRILSCITAIYGLYKFHKFCVKIDLCFMTIQAIYCVIILAIYGYGVSEAFVLLFYGVHFGILLKAYKTMAASMTVDDVKDSIKRMQQEMIGLVVNG